MKSKLTKYGLMIIAAVLVVAMAFAGAASAAVTGITIKNATGSYDLTQENDIVYGDYGTLANGTATLKSTSSMGWVLELNNFKVTRLNNDTIIGSTGVPNLTIVLTGDSNLTGSYSNSYGGLLAMGGNLTINSTTGGKLFVNNIKTSINTKKSSIYVYKDLTIKDGANVTAFVQSSSSTTPVALFAYEGSITITGENTVVNAISVNSVGDSESIYASNNITIEDGANVTAIAKGNANIAYALYALKSVIINGTDTVVYAKASSETSSAYAVFAMNKLLHLKSAKKITAIGTTNTGTYATSFYSKYNPDIAGLANYAFSNATTPGEEPTSYNNFSTHWGNTSGYDFYSNYTAVTIVGKSTYSVTYDGNGNTSGTVPVDATEYEPDANVTVLGNTGNLAKTGYVFNGWYNGTTLFQPNDKFKINEDTTLYANWTLSPYVEVDTWAGLNKSVSEWTNTDEARTVAVNTSIIEKVAGNETTGILVKGKIILTTNASPAGNGAVIDGKGLGRLFDVNGGNLTLCGNGTATLNLTGGNASVISDVTNQYGGAIYARSGNLTVNDGAMITNCSASSGGAVYSSTGTFTMTNGTISDCKVTGYGGGVMLSGGDFKMYGGNISNCEAPEGNGGGVYSSAGYFTMTGSSITNCSAANGGGVYSTGYFTLTGGSITNCSAANGGGVYSTGYFGYFTLTGGSITENTATGTDSDNAGGVYVAGKFNVSGDATVTDNMRNGVTSNVFIVNDESLTLVGPFNGSIGVNVLNVKTQAGVPFGNATADASGAENLVSDTNANLVGSISGDKLVWKDATPYVPSSSSKQTGSTQILQEGQAVPTAYATAAPTAAPTVKPTEKPATPTVVATEKPTTQPTQQSPAPFVGILAGLGAAAVLLRLRK